MTRERDSSTTRVLLKTLVFIVLVPGTVTMLLPWKLLSSERAVERINHIGFQAPGVLAIVFGVALGTRCFWLFAAKGKGTPAPIDPPKHLVTAGPYRRVRNPMYVAIMAILLGEAAYFGSRSLLVYAGVCFIAFSLFVCFYEEPTLRRKFGAAYEEHCREVPRWIPRFGFPPKGPHLPAGPHSPPH